ncbi:MAG: hypothetical protein QXP36_03830 [Conexivisphaerales archaeon]
MEKLILGIDELIKNANSFKGIFSRLFPSDYLDVLFSPYMPFLAIPIIYTYDRESAFLLRDGKEVCISISNLSIIGSFQANYESLWYRKYITIKRDLHERLDLCAMLKFADRFITSEDESLVSAYAFSFFLSTVEFYNIYTNVFKSILQCAVDSKVFSPFKPLLEEVQAKNNKFESVFHSVDPSPRFGVVVFPVVEKRFIEAVKEHKQKRIEVR